MLNFFLFFFVPIFISKLSVGLEMETLLAANCMFCHRMYVD